MGHFRFLTPIIVLKGTSQSVHIYLGQVFRSGAFRSNVNTILRRVKAVSYIRDDIVHFEPCLGKAGMPRSGAESSGQKEEKGGDKGF